MMGACGCDGTCGCETKAHFNAQALELGEVAKPTDPRPQLQARIEALEAALLSIGSARLP